MVIKQEQDEILRYLKDASNMPGGHADGVFVPETEDEIAEILGRANAEGTTVTVSGAGTGLAGGRTPFGGYIISTERLNRILTIDRERSRAVVQPGVVLGTLQREVESRDLFYPPDPTERNCFMGGTVATNSSGARTFKYGPTRNYIRRLHVMLATGEKLLLNRGETIAVGLHLSLVTDHGRCIDIELPDYTMPATKHAAGYYVKPDMDAIDLFIGSEGTLGIFTEIEVELIPLPEQLFSGVVFFPTEESTLAFVEEARERSLAARTRGSQAGEQVVEARALEYLDADSLELIRTNYPAIPEDAMGGAVWFEQETNSESEGSLLEEWYEMILRHGGLAEQSWFAVGLEDQRRLREFRHAVPSAVYEYLSRHGQTKLGTDMAVPNGRFRELLSYYRSRFSESGLKTVVYGHIGDNHLHANIFVERPELFEQTRAVYESLVIKALELGGTISAEHGVGKIKKGYLRKLYGDRGVEQMRRVKAALDPHWLLGVGTMFDLQS